MILTENVTVRIGDNSGYYRNLGFDVKKGDIIEISPTLLSKGSHVKIKVKCDICGFERELMYKRYYDNYSKHSLYCCSNKCSYIKNQKTNIIKYGKKSFNNIEKIRETCIERYGVGCSLQNQKVKDKIEKTIQDKYGVSHPMWNKDIFKKQQKSAYKIEEKYGLNYCGTHELDFIENYKNKVIIKNCDPLFYLYEDRNRMYHPDYYLPEYNLIVEIKSLYTYKRYIDKNIAKQKSCIEQGYNFIFIIDKNYDEFEKLLT